MSLSSKTRHGILFFFLLCTFYSVAAQSNYKIRFNTINTDDGLSSNTINAITKDNLGFIWIGTNDGLCRYESSGYVKVYRMGAPQIDGGLKSSNIRSLYSDTKGNLWIGTRLGGLTKYHQESDTWKTYLHDSNSFSSISNNEILTIEEDRKGRLWVGTEDGLNVYDYDTDIFTSFKGDKNNPYALQGKAVLSILEDDKGWIWVGTWGGGLHLLVPREDGDIKDAKFRNFIPNEKEGAANIWELYQDSRGWYWVGSRGGGLFLMNLPQDQENESVEDHWQPDFYNYNEGLPEGIASNHLQTIFEDSNNHLWVATVNGLSRLKNIKEEEGSKPKLDFYNYVYNSKDETSLANNDISTIFEDGQGIIWFGTYSGISQYNPFTNQFEVHELFDDISKTPNAQNLYIDKDEMAWMGSGENGLLKYDLKNEKIISLGKNQKLFDNSYVSAVFSPDDVELYIGTKNGIAVLNMKTDAVRSYPLPPAIKNRLNTFFVRSLFKDKMGRIWIGSEQGLFVIFEQNGLYIPVLHDIENPNTISDNSVNHIYEDHAGDIWISTYNGLNKLKSNVDNQFYFQQYKHDINHPGKSIPCNRSVALEEIDGILYIGSDNGLSGYDLEEEVFYDFSKNANKYSIQSLEKTIDGDLWASTTEGIIFFDTKLKTFNRYKKQDGLVDITFQSGSSYRDQNNNFYFGSRLGITKFNPKDILKNEIPPPVYITDVKKICPERKEQFNGSYAKEIILKHNQYYLALNYVALNYNRSEKNTYAFMLEGFDSHWNYTSVKSPAIYTNLKPGEYTFRVKAANNDGVWNEEGLSLKVIKRPALLEIWWVKISMLILVGLIAWLGVRSYIRNVNERNKILQKYNDDLNAEIKTRKFVEAELQERERKIKKSNKELQQSNKELEQFAYIASHDLQEPLRVVGSFVSLLRRRYSQHFDEDAFQYIDFAVDGVKRMSEQIQNILTFSKVGKQKMVIESANLNNIIKLKLHDLSQKIKENKTAIHVSPMPIIYCEKNQISMVFYNLISNAVKFNKNEKPSIEITCDEIHSDDFWQFSVSDNGIGIASEYQDKVFEIFRQLNSKRDYEGTGIGLALCEKIIHRHNGEIWFTSEEGKGTTFSFTVSKKLRDKKQAATLLQEQGNTQAALPAN